MSKLVEETAHQVLETVPMVMRTIRAEFRGQRSADLSVPQFRALAFIKNNDGASLSNLADHIGLTLPSMSKLIDGLVGRGLVSRDAHHEDRRRICLRLTTQGKNELDASYSRTQAFLADQLCELTKDELNMITRSMQILKGLFVSSHIEKSAIQEKE
ncbi:MAG TPA: MarR family transcriptional regulator [Anaerolineales bacterium]|nr:MarR family transcriptional regulator [Anaerolineales bacterium]